MIDTKHTDINKISDEIEKKSLEKIKTHEEKLFTEFDLLENQIEDCCLDEIEHLQNDCQTFEDCINNKSKLILDDKK
ncbi:MAG: hypothetical protein ACTSWR_06130 [Candidatus Helarchaeota archaeon]